MTRSHRLPLDIGFKHCDPAGIVFYPRYVEILNDVVEHWFKHGLGCDFVTLHGPRGIAVPVAKLEVDFKEPAMLGNALIGQLTVRHIGKSSLRLRIDMLEQVPSAPERIKLFASLTLVFVRMDGKRPIDIPSDLRTAAERYLIDSTAPLRSTAASGFP